MLNRDFINNGFCFIESDYYLNQENAPSLHDLKKIFDLELENDSDFRKRAYLKLNWCRITNKITIAETQIYYQTLQSNNQDGGKSRQFKILNQTILDIPIIKTILEKNLKLINMSEILPQQSLVTIGLHFIRYQVNQNGASYSSPIWLHKDDEPLVLIHLISLSKTALGGDNLIANNFDQKITHVVRLENEIDTLALNQNVYHAVTPLGSKKGLAHRDVILFTIEPSSTQQ